jgi:hypothetical protein
MLTKISNREEIKNKNIWKKIITREMHYNGEMIISINFISSLILNFHSYSIWKNQMAKNVKWMIGGVVINMYHCSKHKI